MDEEKHVYMWHDCLNCADMYTDDCPLEGEDELEKITDRIRKPADFFCTRFLTRQVN